MQILTHLSIKSLISSKNLRKKNLIRLHTSKITSFGTHHFIKNIKSPLLSVAPMIRSGSRFLAKPRGFSGYKWRQQTHELMQETGTLTNVFFMISETTMIHGSLRIGLTLATFLSKNVYHLRLSFILWNYPLVKHPNCYLQLVSNRMQIGKGCKSITLLTTSFFLASASGSSVEAFLLTAAGFSLMFFWASKNPEISSGQSRFSSGSQVLSALNEQEEGQ